jgi:hypothetical protein
MENYMKSVFTVIGLLIASTSAFADGFVCESQEEALLVKVFNKTTADAGTRNAAVMVLSDMSVAAGNKTIARFSDTNQTLVNDGASYEANVDLRFNDSGRKGELIAGTKLGMLDTIQLHVEFMYSEPKANGSHVAGHLVLVKRNGEEITIEMDCVRYLKN